MKKLIILDLETSGLDPFQDEIIEYASIECDPQSLEVLESYGELYNPGKKLDPLISEITSIYDEDLEGKQHFQSDVENISKMLDGAIICGHNVAFDKGFLVAKGVDLKNCIFLDTFLLANFLSIDESSLNLSHLTNAYNTSFKGAHRAINDIEGTRLLLQALREKYKTLDEPNKEIIEYFFSISRDKIVYFLYEFLGIKKNKGLNFNSVLKHVFQNTTKNRRIFEDKYLKKSSSEDINIEDEIVKNFSGFIPRQKQEDLINTVYDSFINNKKLIVEAPTGIGKTYGYLMSAITYGYETKQKSVIALHTKSLQDQILNKDIPYLREISKIPFSAISLKGKKNYVGIKQIIDYLQINTQIETFNETSFWIKIFFWLIDTQSGELQELDFYGEEYKWMNEILNYNGISDLEYKGLEYDEWYDYMIYKAKSADIIITNMALLFADSKNSGSIFSDIPTLIIDEAHNIEDAVTSALKSSLHISQFQGLESKYEDFAIVMKNESFKKQFDQLYSNLELFFDNCETVLRSKFSYDDNYQGLYLSDKYFEKFPELSKSFELVLDAFKKCRESIKKIEQQQLDNNKTGFLSYLDELFDVFVNNYPFTSSNTYFFTIYYDTKKGINFTAYPFSPSQFLQNNIYSKHKNIFLTSATLRINESFDVVTKFYALEDFEKKYYKSIFDYSKQSLILIPNDLGDIRKDNDAYLNFLLDLFTITQGETLLLSTSFAVIRQIFVHSHKKLQQKNINLIAQGLSGGKKNILTQYKNNPTQSILLGAMSFWEGIDFPGDLLKYLIIYKIPFPVPSDPVFMARSSLYKDSFKEYAIPKAIFKLRQGFGRLIRSPEDAGIAIFLDNRIQTTQWGELCMDAFPSDAPVKYVSSSKILEVLKGDK